MKNNLSLNYSKDDFLDFLKIYKNRPFVSNEGGMKLQHSFFLHFLLKKIKPKIIIESGVHKGHSTFIIEKTLPNSKILCFEPQLDKILYKSKKAKYYNYDLKHHDFSKLDKFKTLLFLDDHQSFVDRLYYIIFNKFIHVAVDDNFLINGDCYSPKQIFLSKAYNIKYFILNFLSIKTIIRFLANCLTLYSIKKKYFTINNKLLYTELISKFNYIPSRHIEKKILKENLDYYYEFPQLIKINFLNKFKNLNNKNFLYKNFYINFFKKSLNKNIAKVFLKNELESLLNKFLISKKDLDNYNNFCYLKFKNNE